MKAAERDERTLGQRAADRFVLVAGSWPFVFAHGVLIVAWILWNRLAATAALPPGHFDPPPFMGLNLVLSSEAALAFAVLLLSQNRQAAKDRQLAREDYDTNVRAEAEIAAEAAQLATIAEAEARLHARFDGLEDALVARLLEELAR